MEQREELLGLYGPEDSKYLRLVARRAAAEEGIKTAWVAGPTPGCVAYVADTDAGCGCGSRGESETDGNQRYPAEDGTAGTDG